MTFAGVIFRTLIAVIELEGPAGHGEVGGAHKLE